MLAIAELRADQSGEQSLAIVCQGSQLKLDSYEGFGVQVEHVRVGTENRPH